MKKKQDHSSKNNLGAAAATALGIAGIGAGVLYGRHLINKRISKPFRDSFSRSSKATPRVDLSSAKKVSKPDVALPKDAYATKVAFLKGFEKAAAMFSQGIVQGAKNIGKKFMGHLTGSTQAGFQQGAKTMVRQGMVGTGANQVSKDAIRAQGAGLAAKKWAARGAAGAAVVGGANAMTSEKSGDQQPR